MLTSTFIHVPGIGTSTERKLWGGGITTWQECLDHAESLPVPRRHHDNLKNTTFDSLRALQQERVDYFARNLPSREHWRAASSFPRLGFLDIETDGGMEGDSITIIGLGDGFDTEIYVKGRDLPKFAFDCQDYDGFVTFFGAGFDLPMLKRRFPVLENVFADRLHIDLCPLMRRLGYTGGLKNIERAIKIQRTPETDGLSGLDAVRLWQQYQYGGRRAEEALELLLAYNREDVVNMKLLLDFALPKMQEESGWNLYRRHIPESVT